MGNITSFMFLVSPVVYIRDCPTEYENFGFGGLIATVAAEIVSINIPAKIT